MATSPTTTQFNKLAARVLALEGRMAVIETEEAGETPPPPVPPPVPVPPPPVPPAPPVPPPPAPGDPIAAFRASWPPPFPATPLAAPILLPALSFFAPMAQTRMEKKVGFHKMASITVWPPSTNGVDGAKREIIMAQSMGGDYFALNCGSWNQDYQDAVANLYDAAQQLGTGFQLFLSSDGLANADIIAYMNKYATHPNHLKRNGRPVLSTFGGDVQPNGNFDAASTKASWAPVRAAFPNMFFAAGFNSLVPADVASVKGWTDGLMSWTAFPDPNPADPASSMAANDEAFAVACKAAGILWGASPFLTYWGSVQITLGRRYYEFQGGIGMDVQMRSIINTQDPEWIEVLTWNDFNESYMMPIDDFTKYNPGGTGVPLGWYKDHRGFAELLRYYIQWFKTGVQPTIAKDAIFWFYRTVPVASMPTNDPQGGVTALEGPVSDRLYLTVALTAPATVKWNDVGGGSRDLPAGLTHFAVPFAVGPQAFSIVRGGATVASGKGDDIVPTSALANFWETSGFATA